MAGMEVLRIADGLWRWTAPHPDWAPGGTGSAAWPELVGAVYYEAPDATVLIDPIVPADQAEAARFWGALAFITIVAAMLCRAQ